MTSTRAYQEKLQTQPKKMPDRTTIRHFIALNLLDNPVDDTHSPLLCHSHH